MLREKRILGLDLGVASIGWAYLTIGKDENGESIQNILGANSRIFPEAVEGHGKNLKPKNAPHATRPPQTAATHRSLSKS